MRLDLHITKHHPEITRSRGKKLIEDGCVFVSGEICRKVSKDIAETADVSVNIPPPVSIAVAPEDIPLDILYEDRDIIVINKPAGLVVHPGAGNQKGTLVGALLHHCKALSGIGGALRPGIVHRLDKGTSGAMVVAKNDNAHTNLSAQFKARSVEKRYYALVYGMLPKDSDEIKTQIGRHVSNRKKMSTKTRHGRMAETHYKVIKRFGRKLTLVDIKLATGRTHQIRVHMSYLGHPLVGDDLYGGKATKRLRGGVSRPFLHAYKLGFIHPTSGKRTEFKSPLPADLERLLNELA